MSEYRINVTINGHVYSRRKIPHVSIDSCLEFHAGQLKNDHRGSNSCGKGVDFVAGRAPLSLKVQIHHRLHGFIFQVLVQVYSLVY